MRALTHPCFANENGVLFLRAYCYLREDLRAFVIEKIVRIELLEE